MRAAVLASSIALALVSACTTRAIAPNRDTGPGTSDEIDTGSHYVPYDGNFPDTGIPSSGDCSAAAQLVYLVDQNNAFLSYDPGAGTITNIGTLSCVSGGATPFSMAVSRDAVAYVLYSNHHVYAVSTSDASCTDTPFAINQMGFQEFGMGFVSNDVGSSDETLFIAGGAATGIGGGASTLGSIDLSSWTVASIGPLSGSPELTGNGLGELWGFFPDTSPMAVRQLDKTTGARIQEYDVSAIHPGTARASAWAFAYYGERYYMFYQAGLETQTSIYTLTPDTNAVAPVMMNIGYTIVGAGVSTCAPTILI